MMTTAPSRKMPSKKISVIRNNQLDEADDDEADVELLSPTSFFGSHINLIPLQSAVQAPRLFYGARFFSQAVPLAKGEEALVQNLDDDETTTFDEKIGRRMGAVFADEDGEIEDVAPDFITFRGATGSRRIPLAQHLPFNRKTSLTQTPVVTKGQKVTAGSPMARSNYTSERGALALGANLRIALVPYKGFSMDDAVVMSQTGAGNLRSVHSYQYQQERDEQTKLGRNHFSALFPTRFTRDQLKHIDDDGVVKPGTVLQPGDPMILATRPRTMNSGSGNNLSALSKAMRIARRDAAQVWDGDEPGIVRDVAHNKGNVKVWVETELPAKVGDKIALRQGQKGVISLILPDDHMPRGQDGKPMDMLLNQLGIPSRVNNATLYELLLGKIAKATGQPYRLRGFNKPGEKWYDMVEAELAKHGIPDAEELWDPQTSRKLQQPVTTGYGYVLKLHHTAGSKWSARGNSSYDANQQPLRGSSEGGGSKRLSGLETNAMLSSGAYANLREGSTLRGQRNDEYWRAIRAGHTPPAPGAPFVFDKFRAMLQGSGMLAKHLGGGTLRLGPFTDEELEKRKAIEVRNGDTVDTHTWEPVKNGLFDAALTSSGRWGKISLPFAIVNPAFEANARHLLGLTKQQYQDVLAGRAELPIK